VLTRTGLWDVLICDICGCTVGGVHGGYGAERRCWLGKLDGARDRKGDAKVWRRARQGRGSGLDWGSLGR
jgi:hypothetical protein